MNQLNFDAFVVTDEGFKADQLLPPAYSLRLVREADIKTRPQITSPTDVCGILNGMGMRDLNREHLIALYLDNKNRVIGSSLIHVGNINSSVFCPAEILKPALLMNTVAIIVAHNHPSGDTTPSQEDIIVTRNLNKACDYIQLDLLDHIIVGDDFYSMKEHELF